MKLNVTFRGDNEWIAKLQVITALLLVLCTPSLFSQVKTADVVGIVTDNSGAAVPGAKVTAENVETNVIRSTVTDSAGSYVLTFLSVGTYDIHVVKDGFAQSVRGSVVLSVGDRLRADFAITVG